MNKVIAVKEAGSAETLMLVELPIPIVRENEILIEQIYSGVNYGDAIRRKRGLFTLNEHGYFIPGFEGVGIIKQTGQNVTKFKIGDRVSYLSELGGGYSQYVCIPQDFAYKVPSFIDDKVASVISCVGSTAICLTSLANIQIGDYVLIHGATGGVGLILVQICNALGAKPIALVSSEEKLEFIKRYNPFASLLRTDEDLINQINSLTNKIGVASIFDCVGQDAVDINLGTIKKGGKILYYGSTSGHPSYQGLPILMNSLTFQGFNVFNKIKDTQEWEKDLSKLFELIKLDKVKFYIEQTYSMMEAFQSHINLEQRKSIGKLIIEIK